MSDRQPLKVRLRTVREAAGISQERLAERIGTSRRHVMRLERGQHVPGELLRAAWARECGVDAAELEPDEPDEDERAKWAQSQREALMEKYAS